MTRLSFLGWTCLSNKLTTRQPETPNLMFLL